MYYFVQCADQHRSASDSATTFFAFQALSHISAPFSQRKRAHYYITSIADTALFLKRYFAALFDGSYYKFLFNITLKFFAFYKLF